MNNPPSTAAANHIPSSLRLVTIARLAEILAELQRETPGLLSATLASADGLTVAQDSNRRANFTGATQGRTGFVRGLAVGYWARCRGGVVLHRADDRY